MIRITARQRLILETIAETGTGLTVRDLGERVGLSSSSSAFYQLGQLEKKRFLRRSGSAWTTVELTPMAVSWLASPVEVVPRKRR
ncbi:LexA family protein [Streptomyces sp. NPDC060048]|uniref:LexA family protein n=1 Tax=unclassified Streptomyces TaxID=2593676 RepID=UPI0036A7BBB0